MESVEPIRDKKKIEAIKKILKASSLRNYCFFTIGINSGLRISDLLSLKISDVLDDKNKIRDRISLKEKKTGKIKDFPVSDVAKKAIREYLDTRKYTLDEPMFISRKGESRINRQQAYRIINLAARTVGITCKIGTQTLRKTCGYHAFQTGIDITLLQKLFNHSAPSITLAYIGITQDELDDVYLNLNL